MRNLIIIFLLSSPFLVNAQKTPIMSELKQVAQLSSNIPQRVEALAFDGEKLWFALYLGKGRYATFNPATNEWKYSDLEEQHKAIRQITQPFNSAGGMVFTKNKLWLSGSYGEMFGSINLETWQVEKEFKQKLRKDLKNSQSYADMTFDGTYIWMAWHLFDFRLADSDVQKLLKIEPESGKVVENFPLPIGTRNDATHGLTWDGETLWHIKDNKLSAINSSNGKIIKQYVLKSLKRPSGLVYDGKNLWIVEFDGKLWSLPLNQSSVN